MNITDKTEVVSTANLFSNLEKKLINEFCESINLEFGELDILRDNNKGKIYIIDVNNTPHGPPANISKKDKKFVIKALAKTFEQAFF